MSGELFLAATPIGNLLDLTPRVSAALAECDFVAAEDTRVTIKILSHLGLKKELVSYHQNSDRSRAPYILDRIEQGESCVLCCDAGTPAISDPGEEIVRLAAERGVRVTPLPGSCAAITALCASGLETGRFCFEGFLTQNRRSRRERLQELKGERRTLIFYEAPHKLRATLADMYEAFGNRRITLARELTKIHEEFVRTDLESANRLYQDELPRGEFVLVVEGDKTEAESPDYSENDILELVNQHLESGLKPSEACRRAAAEAGADRQEVYRLYINSKEDGR